MVTCGDMLPFTPVLIGLASLIVSITKRKQEKTAHHSGKRRFRRVLNVFGTTAAAMAVTLAGLITALSPRLANRDRARFCGRNLDTAFWPFCKSCPVRGWTLAWVRKAFARVLDSGEEAGIMQLSRQNAYYKGDTAMRTILLCGGEYGTARRCAGSRMWGAHSRRAMSSGRGEVKCSGAPVSGWARVRACEWSAGRAMRALSSVP